MVRIDPLPWTLNFQSERSGRTLSPRRRPNVGTDDATKAMVDGCARPVSYLRFRKCQPRVWCFLEPERS